MTWLEYRNWLAYTEKYGPLHPIRMYDQPAAVVAATIAKANGGSGNISDFIFYGKGANMPEVADDLKDLIKSGRMQIGKRSAG